MIYLISGTQSINPKFKSATIEDVLTYCKDKKVLGVDTETEGFDFTCKKMIMFQIGDADNQYIIDTRFISIEPLRNILESKNIIKIFHNAKFDYKFIKKWSNITCEGIYDTFLAELVISCGKGLGYALKDLCKRYLNVELNKDVRNQFIGLKGEPYREDQIIYGAKDIEYLCKIKELQQPIIQKYKLENVVELENKVVKSFADIEYNGLDLDVLKWKELKSLNTDNADKLEKELDVMIKNDKRLTKFIARYIQADMFTPIEELRDINIKWTSPKQVLSVFKTLIPKLDNVNGKAMYKHRFKYRGMERIRKFKYS